MFTGIIVAVGHIDNVESLHTGVRLTITSPISFLEDVKIGDSIAMNGACMTVIQKQKDNFKVDVSQESLSCTVGLNQTGFVNLEKALCLKDPLGGHLVAGHVDGIGRISYFEAIGESYILKIIVPRILAKYCAKKGSITINGISLTINEVEDHSQSCEISINIIPHTFHTTTFKVLRIADNVNIEIDMLARYLERILKFN